MYYINKELVITTLTYNKHTNLFKLYYSDLNTGQHPGTTQQSHTHKRRYDSSSYPSPNHVAKNKQKISHMAL
jgi:hypothetical protein